MFRASLCPSSGEQDSLHNLLTMHSHRNLKLVYLNSFSRDFFYISSEFLDLVPELLLSRPSAFCIKYYERRSPTNCSSNCDSRILKEFYDVTYFSLPNTALLHFCDIFGQFQLELVVEGKVLSYSAVLCVLQINGRKDTCPFCQHKFYAFELDIVDLLL